MNCGDKRTDNSHSSVLRDAKLSTQSKEENGLLTSDKYVHSVCLYCGWKGDDSAYDKHQDDFHKDEQ